MNDINRATTALKEVQHLYHDSKYVTAWQRAQELGPIREWQDVDTLLIGGRLIRNLGADRLGRILHAKAWRLAPNNPEAVYYKAWVQLDFGRWQAWRFMKKYGELPDADDDLRSDWFALLAQVCSNFRDFDAADMWIGRALKLKPERAWVQTSHSYILQAEDRYDDSLAASREALRLRPHYRPALQHCAYLLTLVGRDDEAVEMLSEAVTHIESGSVWGQLAQIHSELGNHREALDCYKSYVEFSPLLDKYGLNGANAILANEHYLNCEVDAALECAKKVTHSTFFASMAERLETLRANPEKNTGLNRVQLPVGFVRQHHMTCAPATLATLCRYWSRPVNHLELADEICYDGTPYHSERNWAQQHGWIAHEFSVDWATTVKLIDRGIPFTVTTVETTSSHLQAIIGYDAIRETVLIRDPYDRHLVEITASAFLERYRSTGPRGMVLVPNEEAAKLDGIDLPDRELYTHVHNIHVALKVHDRASAQAAFDKLTEAAPESVLTLRAKRLLTGYDGDQVGSLAATEKLLERFPRDAALTMNKLSYLHDFNRRDERMALLREICTLTPAKNKEDKGKGIHDPVFWEMLARETRCDARERERTLWLIRRVIRWRPSDASGYNLLAGEFWDLGRFEEAIDLYRFAACLRDKDEYHQQTYFNALRNFKREETALELMRARVSRWGNQNSLPAQTLHWAYNQLDRNTEAEVTLEATLKAHPTDGELLLYAARNYATTLKRERASELVRQAERCSSRASWLRSTAFLARHDGELGRAREIWKEVLEREPLAVDAHRALARTVAELEGVKQAIETLRAAVERFPANYPLHRLLAEWLRDDPDAQEAALRELLQIHPADGWAYREHALVLRALRRLDEAETAARLALHIEPRASSSHAILADVLATKGDLENARASFRAALEISVDNDYAIHGLVNACTTPAEKRAALQFIYEQIVRQTIFGDSLLAYRALASQIMDADAVLASLREAHKSRPDLWQSWTVMVRQLKEMGQLDEAEVFAREATTRFPLLPRLWIDLAEVYRLKTNRAGREEALRRALAINSSWGFAYRCLAQMFEDEQNYAEARKLLETASARDPLDAINHTFLASVLWKQNERGAAIAKAQEALRVDTSQQWAWDTLRNWGEDTGQPNLAADLARKLTESRPGEARNWMSLARILPDHRECIDERLRALDRVLALEPRNTDAFDLKVVLLTNAARFDEAKAAVNAPIWNGTPPSSLQGRAAWVEAERGNKPAAIEMMRRTLEQDPHYTWGWYRVAEWSNDIGDKKSSLDATDNLVRLLPSESPPYAARSTARLESGDREGAYKDLERALQIQPDYLWAGRKLVDMYLEDGRWDEAERVVAALRSHAPTDAFTIARQAQIDARRRRVERLVQHVQDLLTLQIDEEWPLDKAIELALQFGQRAAVKMILDETTTKFPDYFRGWQVYANLVQDNPKCDEYLKAGQNMTRVRPQSYVAYGYLAYAYKERGQKDDSMRAFEEALKLDPRYDYAAHNLFDHYDEKKQTEDALRVLRVMMEYTHNSRTYWRAVRYYSQQKEEGEALNAFQRLLHCSDDFENAVKLSLDALTNAGMAKRALDALKAALEEESPNNNCGVAWVKWMSEKKDWAAIENALGGWNWDRTHVRFGVREYVMTLVREKNQVRFNSFVASQRERLHANELLWGSVGYGYTEFDRNKDVVEWMSDWRARRGAAGWMLLNLAIAARRCARDQEAHEVSLRAVGNTLDNSTVEHELWLAWDEACDGALDSARKRLAGTDFTKLRAYYKLLHLLSQGMCETLRLRDAATKSAALHAISTCLEDARKASPGDWYKPLTSRMVGKLCQRAFQESRSPRALYWRIKHPIVRLFTWMNSKNL